MLILQIVSGVVIAYCVITAVREHAQAKTVWTGAHAMAVRPMQAAYKPPVDPVLEAQLKEYAKYCETAFDTRG